MVLGEWPQINSCTRICRSLPTSDGNCVVFSSSLTGTVSIWLAQRVYRAKDRMDRLLRVFTEPQLCINVEHLVSHTVLNDTVKDSYFMCETTKWTRLQLSSERSRLKQGKKKKNFQETYIDVTGVSLTVFHGPSQPHFRKSRRCLARS